MKPPSPTPASPPDPDKEDPRVPLLHSWRGVYWFVLGCFVLYVVLLAIFTRAFA